MKNIIRLIGFLTIAFLFSCGDTTSEQNSNKPATIEDFTSSEVEENKTIDYQVLADAYCKCSEPTLTINNKMKRLMDSSSANNPELEKLYPEADKAFKKAVDCAQQAKNKQTLGDLDDKKVMKVLKNSCPDLPMTLAMKLLGTDAK